MYYTNETSWDLSPITTEATLRILYRSLRVVSRSLVRGSLIHEMKGSLASRSVLSVDGLRCSFHTYAYIPR